MHAAIETYRYRAPDDPEHAPQALKTFPGGDRLVVAFNRTYRKVSLIEIGTLRHARVDVAELRFAEPVAVAPYRLRRRIARRARIFRRHGIRYPARAVRAALAALSNRKADT